MKEIEFFIDLAMVIMVSGDTKPMENKFHILNKAWNHPDLEL